MPEERERDEGKKEKKQSTNQTKMPEIKSAVAEMNNFKETL